MSGTTTPPAPTAASTWTSPFPSQTLPAAPSRLDASNGLTSSASSSTNTAAPPDQYPHPHTPPPRPPRTRAQTPVHTVSRRLLAPRAQARPDATRRDSRTPPLNTIGCPRHRTIAHPIRDVAPFRPRAAHPSRRRHAPGDAALRRGVPKGHPAVLVAVPHGGPVRVVLVLGVGQCGDRLLHQRLEHLQPGTHGQGQQPFLGRLGDSGQRDRDLVWDGQSQRARLDVPGLVLLAHGGPLPCGVLGGSPETYQTAGLRWGTATSRSTNRATTSHQISISLASADRKQSRTSSRTLRSAK